MENENLKKIKLFMNYDSKKTLSENLQLLNESAPTIDTNLGTVKLNQKADFENTVNNAPELRLKSGTVFTKKTNGTLVTSPNQAYQLVSDTTGADRGSGVGTITYYCKTNNLDIKGRTDEYKKDNLFIPENAMNEKEAFQSLCNNTKVQGSGGTPKSTTNTAVKPGTTKAVSNVPYNAHWEKLYELLKDLGVNPQYHLDDYQKGITGAGGFWFGRFVINRFGSPFVYWGRDMKYKGVIKGGGKYGGQPLKDVMLNTNVDGSSEMSLAAFVQRNFGGESKSVSSQDAEKSKTIGGGNTNQNISNTKTNTSSWRNCSTGPYSFGCLGSNITKMQECLKAKGFYPYRVDDQFGSKTLKAVKKALGKNSFTDSDITTFCQTTSKKQELDFDNPSQDIPKSDNQDTSTWAGDVY